MPPEPLGRELLRYLRGQLSSGRQDESKRKLPPSSTVVVASSSGLGPALQNTVQDGHEEGGRLATASLCTGHEVTLSQDDRDGMFLERRLHH